MNLSESVRLHDGREIPQLGYGVWQVPDRVASDVVEQAIRAGYRHIDTASLYRNETGVGQAVRASAVPREELFITTKVWNDEQGYDRTLAAAEASLRRLGTDYIDLYLIHWACPRRGTYVETWRALIELQQRGLVRSIGVSNFAEAHLETIIAETGVTPAVHQVELHPYFQQRDMRTFDAAHGIATEAWSPLGQGGAVLRDPMIEQIAASHGADAAQVIIAWHLAVGNVVIPKSVTPERIVSNLAASTLVLAPEEIEQINSLDRPDGRIEPDPAIWG